MTADRHTATGTCEFGQALCGDRLADCKSLWTRDGIPLALHGPRNRVIETAE